MGFRDAVTTCLRKYATFRGRASRPEYWWFFLFLVLGGAATSIADDTVFGTPESREGNGPLATAFSLATLVPSLAAGWRRMHDTGRSGLYLLYPMIVMLGLATFAQVSGMIDAMLPGSPGEVTPFQGIAGIVLIVGLLVFLISPLLVLWWLTRPSEPGPNLYGPPTGGAR